MSETQWRPSTSLPPPRPIKYPYVYRPANYWISWIAVLGLSGIIIGLNDPLHLYSVYEGEATAPFMEDLRWWFEFSFIYFIFHFVGIRPKLVYPDANQIRILNPFRHITVQRSDIASVDTRTGWGRITLRSGKRIMVGALEEWNSAGLAPSTHRELKGMPAESGVPSPVTARADPRWRLRGLTWEDVIVGLIVLGYPAAAAAVRFW